MGDELSDAELKQLEGFMTTDNTVPPPDESEGAPAAAAPEAPAAPAAPSAPAPTAPVAPSAPAAPRPGDPIPAAPEQTDDERFAAWQAQHAGKSPEELAKLAFQQQQRASRAEAEKRRTGETLAQIQDRVRTASERAAAERERISAERTAFQQRLADDPDAATRELHERQITAEEARIAAEEHAARVDAAIGLASLALPDFQERAARVYAFGNAVGYSQQELAGISDGRDLITLSLAEMSARLIQAGMMDMKGNLMAAPPAAEATDPRLTAPTPMATLSSAPARAAPAGNGNVVRQATDILSMNDADFAKLPAAELDALMRQLEG